MMRASFVPRLGDGVSAAAAPGFSPERGAVTGGAGRVASDAVGGGSGRAADEGSRVAAVPS